MYLHQKMTYHPFSLVVLALAELELQILLQLNL